MVTIAVLGGHGGASSSGQPSPPGLAVDRIAYVGVDGAIRTVNPDGSGVNVITPEDGFFTWPTWSTDGRKVVFSGVIGEEQGLALTALYSHNTVTGRSRELHLGEPGMLIAEGAPYYQYLSPDGRHLAFIGNTGEALALYLDDLRDDAAPSPALEQGPLYMDWSPDSRYLLVHRGADLLLLDVENGSMSDLAVVDHDALYRAPSWQPTGDTIAYVTGDVSRGYGLYTSGPDAADGTLVGRVPSYAAFMWSPGGRWLAMTGSDRVLPFLPMQLLVYSNVSVLTADGSQEAVDGIEDAVVAFFWSPDGSKLAYVTLVDATGVLRWNILDADDGTRWPLVDFRPSHDQLTVFQYFDQFARSHSQWSPDSQALVFSGSIVGSAVSTSERQRPFKIIVMPTFPFSSPIVLADGNLGFWSPH